MKYLITGTGRCGTGYIAQVLCSVGIKCTHEQVFNIKGINFAEKCITERRNNPQWGWVGESSWLAVPYLQEPLLKNTLIIHLIRHPKDAIDSFLSMRFWTHPAYTEVAAWATQWLPGLNNCETPEEKSAYFYVKWNQMIEPYAAIRHRVEDPVEQLLDYLGIDYKGKKLFGDTSYNTRRTWPSDIDLHQFGKPLKEMQDKYGYH